MKAAVLTGVDTPLEIRDDIEIAAPGPGEVRIKMAASGVCHSDLSVQNGTIPLPTPIVLGHEGAGVVEEVGEGVSRVAPGDHVVLSFVPACGECYTCIRGQSYLCEKAAMQAMGGLLDGTTRLTSGGSAAAPDGVPRHVRAAGDRPRDLDGEDPRRRAARRRRAHRLRRAHRRRRGAEHRQHPPGRHRRRHRLRRRRPQRDPGRPHRRRRQDHRHRHVRLEARDGQGVRRHRHGQPEQRRRRRPGRRRSPTAAAPTWPSRSSGSRPPCSRRST